jgi:hypothetical protein
MAVRERGREGGKERVGIKFHGKINSGLKLYLLSIHCIEDGVVECQFIEAGEHPVPPVRTTDQANHEHLQAIIPFVTSTCIFIWE